MLSGEKWVGRAMNIVLIGYRCSGKTAVGKTLARDLDREFLDTDALIEEDVGRSIETMISTKGWNRFREIERRLVQQVSRRNHLVIATGGGIVMDEENVKNLKQNGWVVWLKGKPEVLKERMVKEQDSGRIRPSLTGADPLEEIKEVLNVRKPFYKRAGDLVVDTSSRTIGDVAALIIKNLPE
jgi:shikimate kinase